MRNKGVRRLLNICMISILFCMSAGCADEKGTKAEQENMQMVQEEVYTLQEEREPVKQEEMKENELQENDEPEEQNEIESLVDDLYTEEISGLKVFVTREYEEEWKDMVLEDGREESVKLWEISSQTLILDEKDRDKYPMLAERLDEKNEESRKEKERIRDDFSSTIMEAFEIFSFDFGGFYRDTEYWVQRADQHMVSILEEFSDYSGGAHGMYGCSGVNYDTETGKELWINDIIKQTDLLTGIITDKLYDKYSQDTFYENIEEQIMAYEPETYNWTMNDQGLTFYFNPYEIAPYAAGLLTVTLRYEENPSLFEEKYLPVDGMGYIRKLPMSEVQEIDLDQEDNRIDSLSIRAVSDTEEEREYGIYHIEITKNTDIYKDGEGYGFDFSTYLACLCKEGKERYYLYIEGIAENDYKTLSIYDLNGEEISLIKTMSGSGFAKKQQEEGVAEPAFMGTDMLEISTKLDILGTWMGTRMYKMFYEDGIPYNVEDYYTIHHQTEPMISKIPLIVTIFPKEGQEGIEQLPAGTSFMVIGTDGSTYVDFKLEDGRNVRLDVQKGDIFYEIDGISEWDCFESLPYAG